MTEIIDAPSTPELVRRAADLVPHLQEKAPWAEENRRLHEESIEAMADAGIFKLRVPARYGGYESDMRTLVDVLTQVGRGDASAAWTAAVWSICNWLVSLFPDEVQDEVFSTPDVRVCGLLSPTGMATPADGGYVINGKWAFNTGSLQSQWNELVAVAPMPDGQMAPIMALVPMSDLQIIDDWHTVGLRGSGSVSTVAQDLFVPAHRVQPMGGMLHEQYASERNRDNPVYRGPLLLTACTSTIGTALGLAEAARDVFFERLPDRKITYTSYGSQGEAPITHLQVAEAEVKADEARFHAYRAAGELDARNTSGQPWSIRDRARIRLDASYTIRRAKESVDILNNASGASSIYQSVPMQRIERDVQTLNQHAILHPNTNLELYGRILCGLEPNTFYI
jgi:3-hydroxy-9,10-secoandrosta-1,3,5(10)-triene-9,17-dione monooxygenase